MNDVLILKGIQLALARAIVEIERKFYDGAHRDSDREDGAHETASEIVRKLERDADLRSNSGWRQRVPLIDLYDFSKEERDMLLDLADAGGIQITRVHDRRWNKLGCGQGGKAAVMESASQRWKVQLTKRGEALVEAIKNEGGLLD